MSSILVDNLTGKTTAGSVTVTSEGGLKTMQMQQGLTKAWTNYDGSDSSVRDSLNSSSVTDHDTGEHSVSLTNNMGNDDYVYSGGSKDGFNGNYGRIVSNTQTASTSSHRQITVLCNDNSRDDCDEVGTSVHGDLA